MQPITLVRENEAGDERVKEVYRDIKESLRMPFVNMLFQAYAQVPRFLDFTWRRLRPSMLAVPFVERAAKIGSLADRAVQHWDIGDHAAELHARNFGEGDIRRMREIVGVFHQVDPRLLVIANAVALGLKGESVGGAGSLGPPANDDKNKIGSDFRGLSITMVEESEAPLRVRTIYEEIKAATGLPFVNSDYRAMGAWPDWLEIWWKDCKPLLRDPRHAAIGDELRAAAIEAANVLPHQLNMAHQLLDNYGVGTDDRRRITEVNGIFCRSLPSLIVNVAIARRGLGLSHAG